MDRHVTCKKLINVLVPLLSMENIFVPIKEGRERRGTKLPHSDAGFELQRVVPHLIPEGTELLQCVRLIKHLS